MHRYIPLLTLISQVLPVGPQTQWRTWWKETTWFFSADSLQPWQTQVPHSTGSGDPPSSPVILYENLTKFDILSKTHQCMSVSVEALIFLFSGTSTTNMTTSQSGRPPSPPDTREWLHCTKSSLSSQTIVTNRHISSSIKRQRQN